MVQGPARRARAQAAAEAEEYAAARRPDLVRLAVLLGSPPDHAAVLADRTLAGVRAGWSELVAGDPDAQVVDLLLEQRALDRTAWWHRVRPDEVLPPELAPLDRLDPRTRAAVVWGALGREPAGVPGSGDHGASDPGLPGLVARVAAGVPVPPEVVRIPLRSRSSRRLVLGAAAAAVAVGLLVPALRPDERPAADPPLGPVDVGGRPNPAPVAWYAAGRVHLDDGSAAVPDVVALVEMGAGAVYLDVDGQVVALSGDGGRTLLGQAVLGPGLVGSAVRGRVAWVTENDEVEVADVGTGRVVDRLEVGDAEQVGLLRMVGPVLRLTEGGSETAWDLDENMIGEVESGQGQGELVDVVGSTELRQLDGGRVAVDGPFGGRVVVPGDGGEVSPSEEFVLTRTGEGGLGVRVFDAGTGEERASGTTREDLVLDVRFTGADEITYLLGDRASLPDGTGVGRASGAGPVEVRTCQVRREFCVVHAAGPGFGETAALLAR